MAISGPRREGEIPGVAQHLVSYDDEEPIYGISADDVSLIQDGFELCEHPRGGKRAVLNFDQIDGKFLVCAGGKGHGGKASEEDNKALVELLARQSVIVLPVPENPQLGVMVSCRDLLLLKGGSGDALVACKAAIVTGVEILPQEAVTAEAMSGTVLSAVCNMLDTMDKQKDVRYLVSDPWEGTWPKPGEPYQSLNDAFYAYGGAETAYGVDLSILAKGDTKVWYQKSRTDGRMFNDVVCDSINPHNMEESHILLGSVAGTDPEMLFEALQGESWSPEGEADDLLATRVAHTSMSVGDAFQMGNSIHICEGAGWKIREVTPYYGVLTGVPVGQWVEANGHGRVDSSNEVDGSGVTFLRNDGNGSASFIDVVRLEPSLWTWRRGSLDLKDVATFPGENGFTPYEDAIDGHGMLESHAEVLRFILDKVLLDPKTKTDW